MHWALSIHNILVNSSRKKQVFLQSCIDHQINDPAQPFPNRYPSHAIGRYAIVRSSIINHVGPPTENTIMIPPSKKRMPILYAADMCLDFVNLIANHAPNNVPNACKMLK